MAKKSADEEMISLNRKQVAHILAVLEHPPAKGIAAVRKLLRERSILDDSRCINKIVDRGQVGRDRHN